MKKALLIFLMFVLPWQATAAAERNLAHLFGGGTEHSIAAVAAHMAEHAAHVPHHHDTDHHHDGDDGDDGDDDHDDGIHQDDSGKSVQHLADYDQGCNMNLLFPVAAQLPASQLPRAAPLFEPDVHTGRTTLPPLRPPRTPA
ncbi:MAG TPA: hypothetical protein VN089_16735 [Duganella sp.]|nr:hypothetical protein [Duganella sp.]